MSRQVEQCNAVPMERLDADLLKLSEIDRDTGTIWFLYNEPLTTREELPGELDRLEDLGWIGRTPKSRWLITSAGSKALSAARNWAFQVDQISQEQECGRHATAIGRLLAGSMAFFADPFCNAFWIEGDDASERIGWVHDVQPTRDPTSAYLVVSLELWEDGRLRRGDLLRFRHEWVGS